MFSINNKPTKIILQAYTFMGIGLGSDLNTEQPLIKLFVMGKLFKFHRIFRLGHII